MISTGEMKKGVCIELDGELYRVLNFEHIKMGRGSAQVKMRLQNLRSGYIVERGFQAGEKFKRVVLEHRTVQYLYRDGDLYHFMDTQTFEQTALSADHLGDGVQYLKDNIGLELLTYRDEPIGVELPITVELKVTETEPGFKGDTATGGSKPAILETGMKILVPLFVDVGDVIKVDTRTGQYLERVT
ncbi:MAG: elongation factor P [Chloroflexi bacterium]|nr:elongation factor P [Chloroflexota bacterium]